MSLTLGREGGIAKPLKKRTVGQNKIGELTIYSPIES